MEALLKVIKCTVSLFGRENMVEREVFMGSGFGFEGGDVGV